MLKKISCIILFYRFIVQTSLAQEPKIKVDNYAQAASYKKAKKNYFNNNYVLCQNELTDLLKEPFTTLTPYAYFYYGLAAYQQGLVEQAYEIFSNLSKLFPAWEQNNEVWYWLAQLAFEKNTYSKALSYLSNIQEKTFHPAIHSLKGHFLYKTQDLNILYELLKNYPDDQLVAEAWLYRQLELPLTMQDLPAIAEISKNLGITHVDPLRDLPSVKKETYHVAVLLPFFIEETESKKNNLPFVLELYQGLEAAVGRLYQQGIEITLHPYDTKKSIEATEKILTHPEMELMDLIIGPLYADTLPLVAAFALKHQINMFNPLSVNSQVVGYNPFAYLIRPTLATQAKQAVYFTQKNADLSSDSTRLGIIYGYEPEDHVKAYLYKNYLYQITGKEIDLMLQLEKEGAQEFLHSFRNTKPHTKEKIQQEEAPKKEILDNLTHIYIASQDELVVTNVLSALQMRKLEPFLLIDEGCITKDLLSIDQLKHPHLFIIAPNYIDYHKKSFHNFRLDFYDAFSTYPSYYASMGYETMYYLGTMLHQHGTYFQKTWSPTKWEGYIFDGLLHDQHHDNQHVPIIKFDQAVFVNVN